MDLSIIHDHVRNMDDLLQPLRNMVERYDKHKRLEWTQELITIYEESRRIIADCQQLFFMVENARITLQTDASDFGIDGYLFQTVDNMVQVIMCISKALVGAQLRWSVREKECYGIFYCFKVLEDMLKHVKFHLKTDHKNLVYINCALTGKVARWKLYMQDWNFTVSWVEGQEEHQQVPDKLSRLVSNPEETETSIDTETAVLAVAVAQVAISDAEYAIISSQHNAIRGHSGVDVTLNRLRNGGYTFPNLELKVRTFIRKCPLCQLTSQIKPLVKAQKFTTAALYPFQVICADHIGPLPKDREGYQYILVVICAFSRWIELFPTKTTTAEETARCIHQHFGRWGTADRLRTDNGLAFANDLLKGLANLLGSTNEFTTAYS